MSPDARSAAALEANRPQGRPKGSKNKITLLKMVGEQAVRDKNMALMVEVCEKIINQALDGDKSSQKLVWNAMVSNGVSEEGKTTERVEITIGSIAPPEHVTIIDQPKEEV